MTSPTPPPAPAVSRAAVVRGLVWTAPAVAAVAVAPLAAASPAQFTVNFAAGRASTTATDGPTISVGVSSTGTLTRTSSDLTLVGAQTVTITFGDAGKPRAVQNLSFTVSGLTHVANNGTSGVRDSVTVTPAATVSSRSGASGSATAGSPLQAAVAGVEGSAVLTVAGPTESVTITLTSTLGKATPSVVVSGMSFTTDTAGL